MARRPDPVIGSPLRRPVRLAPWTPTPDPRPAIPVTDERRERGAVRHAIEAREERRRLAAELADPWE